MSKSENWMLKELAYFMRIGNRAVRKARHENLKKGLCNVYTVDGKIFYELPDGTFTSKYPG